MDRIQEEISENGRFLLPFKSSGRSLVDHFLNLMNYALRMCSTKWFYRAEFLYACRQFLHIICKVPVALWLKFKPTGSRLLLVNDLHEVNVILLQIGKGSERAYFSESIKIGTYKFWYNLYASLQFVLLKFLIVKIMRYLVA